MDKNLDNLFHKILQKFLNYDPLRKCIDDRVKYFLKKNHELDFLIKKYIQTNGYSIKDVNQLQYMLDKSLKTIRRMEKKDCCNKKLMLKLKKDVDELKKKALSKKKKKKQNRTKFSKKKKAFKTCSIYQGIVKKKSNNSKKDKIELDKINQRIDYLTHAVIVFQEDLKRISSHLSNQPKLTPEFSESKDIIPKFSCSPV